MDSGTTVVSQTVQQGAVIRRGTESKEVRVMVMSRRYTQLEVLPLSILL